MADNMSFDEFVQQGRKRRKAEQLAQEIFGKNRNSGARPNDRRQTSSPMGGSLASRMGVNKRPNNKAPNPAAHHPGRLPPTAPSHNRLPTSTDRPRNSRAGKIAHRLPQTDPSDLFPTRQQQSSNARTRPDLFPGRDATYEQPVDAHLLQKEEEHEVSIRGAAGPFCVVASNFAPGTTAADVESVMEPVGGEMVGCTLVSAEPTVIIEMLFVNKPGADNVVSMFNNRRADGRVLYVYFKKGGPTKLAPPAVQKSPLRTAPRSDSRSVAASGTFNTESAALKDAGIPHDDELMIIDSSDDKPLGRTPTGPRNTHDSEPSRDFGRAWQGQDSRNQPTRFGGHRERGHYQGSGPRDGHRNGGGPGRNRGGLYSDNMRGRMPDRPSDAYYRR